MQNKRTNTANMKKTITILFFFSTIMLSWGQKENPKDIFQKDIKAYSEAYNKKDWEKVTSMIYPKLFDILPKQQMIMYLNLMGTMGMSIELNFKQVDSISEIVKSGKEKYCRVYYSGVTKLKIGDGLSVKSIDKIKEQSEDLYGKENVKYDDKEKLFTMNTNQCMIAIADKKSKEWKYIEYTKENQNMLPKLVPEEARTKLKL